MSSGNPPKPPTDYYSSSMGSAVNNAYQGIQNFGQQPNLPQQNYQNFAPAFSGMQQNSGYNPADTVNAGNWMTQQSQNLSPYVIQMLDEGFDPQNDVYGRAAHNLQDQTRVGLAARGLDSSPYGAGVEGATMGNFNLDWENNKLGRMGTAMQGAGGLQGTINQGVMGGQQLAGSVPGWQAQVAQALSQMGLAGQQMPQNLIQDWLNYTNQGQQSQMNRYNAQYQSYQDQQAADNAMWSGIGSLAGGVLGGPFGAQLGSAAGGLFAGGGSSGPAYNYGVGGGW